LVTYLLIIMVTILSLTYIAYRWFPLMSYGLSPKMVVRCGITAFVLVLLSTQIVVYVYSIGMVLGLLLVMLILSSSVLVFIDDIPAEGAVDPQIIISTTNNYSIPDEKSLHIEGLAATTTDQVGTVSEHLDTVVETDIAKSLDTDITEVVEAGTNEKMEAEMAEVVEMDIDDALEVDDISEFKNSTDLVEIVNIPVAENVETNNIAEVEADFDYYLEVGFKAKEDCNYKDAILAFEKAIDLEPDSVTALFVITEICALLKLLGYYDEAIHQMESGRNLALHFGERGMVDQFVEGIAYLRIIKNALMAEGVFSTPYQALPEGIKEKVEEEFRQWKMNT